MSHLVLELRQGDMMVVNGATIRFRNRCRIELVSQAKFLFGKQIMAPEEAATDCRRLYYALQTAYVGDEERQRPAHDRALVLVSQLRFGAGEMSRSTLDSIEAALQVHNYVAALKIARILIRAEDAFMASMPDKVVVASEAGFSRPVEGSLTHACSAAGGDPFLGETL